MKSNDIRRLNTSTHSHNCLMGTITFKIHHIDKALKISRLDASGLNDLKGLKKKNKESKKTEVDQP